MGGLEFFFYVFFNVNFINWVSEFFMVKNELKISTTFVWDYYYGLVISLFIFCFVVFVISYIIRTFNSNNFNLFLDLDLIFLERSLNNVKNYNEYFEYIFFSICFLGIPIFSIYTTSYSYGGLYLDSEKSRVPYVLRVVTFQWGWDVVLFKFDPCYINFILYPGYSNSRLGVDIGGVKLDLEIAGLKRITPIFTCDSFYHNKNSFGVSFLVPSEFPVLIETFSKDVNHCLGVIDLGLKLDSTGEKILVNYLTIFPINKSQINFFCFEYCGLKHSEMVGSILTLRDVDIDFF